MHARISHNSGILIRIWLSFSYLLILSWFQSDRQRLNLKRKRCYLLDQACPVLSKHRLRYLASSPDIFQANDARRSMPGASTGDEVPDLEGCAPGWPAWRAPAAPVLVREAAPRGAPSAREASTRPAPPPNGSCPRLCQPVPFEGSMTRNLTAMSYPQRYACMCASTQTWRLRGAEAGPEDGGLLSCAAACTAAACAATLARACGSRT